VTSCLETFFELSGVILDVEAHSDHTGLILYELIAEFPGGKDCMQIVAHQPDRVIVEIRGKIERRISSEYIGRVREACMSRLNQ
jgi:hypothetical protein